MGNPKQGQQQEVFDFMLAAKGGKVSPPFDPNQISELARRGVYIGSASWRYRGWEGLIYRGGYASESQFQRQSLKEYSALLPCVGLEATAFTWPTSELISQLLESTPDSFRFCPKVTQKITMRRFPQSPAYGRSAGMPNPDFLNAELFHEKFLVPLFRLGPRLGMVQFEFLDLEEGDIPLLESFFARIPRDFPICVEIQNAQFVNKTIYRRWIELDLSPVFHIWPGMPPLSRQWNLYLEAGGGEKSLPLLVSASVHPDCSPEEAVVLFQPYQAIRRENPEGRAFFSEFRPWIMKNDRKAFIIIGNRWEGCAPISISLVANSLMREG